MTQAANARHQLLVNMISQKHFNYTQSLKAILQIKIQYNPAIFFVCSTYYIHRYLFVFEIHMYTHLRYVVLFKTCLNTSSIFCTYKYNFCFVFCTPDNLELFDQSGGCVVAYVSEIIKVALHIIS